MRGASLHPTTEDVYQQLGAVPVSAAVIGIDVVAHMTGYRPVQSMYQSVPQLISSYGLPANRVQRVLDALVAEGRAFKVNNGNRNQTGYISDVWMTRRLEKAAEQAVQAQAQLAANQRQALLRQAEQVVLARHDDELQAVLAELTEEAS